MINISKELKQVWDFQEAFGHSQTTSLNIGLQKDRKLRLDLQLEELGELHKALYENNHVETLDAIIDGLYICFGSVHYHGLLSFASYMEGEEMIDLEITQYPIEINLVLNQIIFFKKATKYLEKTTDTELLNYVNNYKNIFINKLISKLDLSFGLEIVWKTHMLHPEEYNKSTINFDMVKAIRRQELFMKDILKLNINKEIISKAVQEYNNFLELFKLGNRNNLAPKPIVDLIWHTHQQFPEKYKTECVKFAGVFLNHNDDVEKEIIQKAYEERKNIEKINK